MKSRSTGSARLFGRAQRTGMVCVGGVGGERHWFPRSLWGGRGSTEDGSVSSMCQRPSEYFPVS